MRLSELGCRLSHLGRETVYDRGSEGKVDAVSYVDGKAKQFLLAEGGVEDDVVGLDSELHELAAVVDGPNHA